MLAVVSAPRVLGLLCMKHDNPVIITGSSPPVHDGLIASALTKGFDRAQAPGIVYSLTATLVFFFF